MFSANINEYQFFTHVCIRCQLDICNLKENFYLSNIVIILWIMIRTLNMTLKILSITLTLRDPIEV